MGGTRDDKRTKRAREDLKRGLARRDPELACDGLLALPAPERRGEHLAAVAALFAATIAQAQIRGEWSRLVSCAKRLEGEPRLLTVLEQGAACAVRWALLWGCAQSGEWTRAARLWADLAPEVAARRGALAEAVGAWIASRGEPRSLPAVIASFAPEAPDPRLGIEQVSPRTPRGREPAVPRTPQQAHETVVRARALLGSGGMSAWVARALEVVDADTARTVGEVASSIALRDALVRMEDRSSDVSGPLDVMAACAQRGVAPAAHLLTSFRIVLRSLAPEGAAPRADTLCAIVRACMQHATIAPIVRDALLGIARDPAGASVTPDSLLAALGVAAEIAPSAALWATGAVLAMHEERSGRHRARRAAEQALAWLEQRGAQFATQADDLVAWMRAADTRARRRVLAFAADRLPANAAGLLLVAVSSIEDERLKSDVASSVEDLLGRFSTRYCASCGFDHEPELLTYRDLSPVARGLWNTMERDVCDLSPTLLSLALERAVSAAARGALIQRFAHRAESAGAWLEAIAIARRFRLRKLPAELLERMLARFAHEPGELAAAYQIAWSEIGRVDVLVPIARGLVQAMRSPTAASVPERVAAIAGRAQQLLDVERAREARRASRRGRGVQLVFAATGGSDGAA